MMVFHRRSKRVKIFSKTFVTKYLYKRDSNASKRTCILIDIIHKYLKEKTRKKKRKWSVLSYYRLSPADKSLWFDVQVNEIYVKFRFTGSGFWAPDGQNDMKWVFTNFNKKNSTLFGKTNHSMFDYSLRVIDELKMSEIRILNLCHKKSILVDIYRQSLLSRHMKGVPLFKVRHSKEGPFLSKTSSWMEYHGYKCSYSKNARLSLILLE